MPDTSPMDRLRACLVACVLFGVFTATASAQPYGYIVNAADPAEDGSHDNLWRVDLATGFADNIGPVNLPTSANPQSDIEGLALRTSSQLYGVDDATDSLVIFALATGGAQPVRRPRDNLELNLQGGALDPGLAFDCDGNLLMSSATRRTLYRLNRQSGQASVIGGEGRLGVRIGDISVRGGEVYGIGIDGDEGLYRIDADNGQAELIGGLGVDLNLTNVGIDFDGSGNLWAVGHIVDGRGQPQPSRIFRVDRESGQASLGPTTRVGVKSLAIRPPRCSLDPPAPPPGPGPGDRGTYQAVPVNAPGALVVLLAAVMLLARRRLG